MSGAVWQTAPQTRNVAIVVDAANLRTGGAITVAASFLDELGEILRDPRQAPAWAADLRVHVSPEVLANLAPGTAVALPLEVLRRRPRDWRTWLRPPDPARLVFTLFGPRYGPSRSDHLMMGFADGLSLYPRPAGLPPETGRERLVRAVRSRVSRASFRHADQVVAQTPAVAERLATHWRIRRERLSVVPGTFNKIIAGASGGSAVSPVRVPRHPGAHHFGYVARAHAHKNHDFLGELGRHLGHRGVAARFVVTLTAQEWAQRSSPFRDHAVNVGPVTVPQLNELYSQCDSGIFPSLLECFSSTPFEVMQMRLPLFASDRDFVRSSCLDAPIYIDPENPRTAAEVIASALTDPERLRRHVRRGDHVLARHPNARERALAYIRLMDSVMNGGER